MEIDTMGIKEGGVDLRLLSDPALAYVADVYSRDVSYVMSTLQLSPLVMHWAALRREKPEMFRLVSSVEYLPVADVQAPSGVSIRLVDKGYGGMSAAELERAAASSDFIGGLTLGPFEFASVHPVATVSDCPDSLKVHVGELDLPDKGKAVSKEDALLVAKDNPELVSTLPGYCYLKHFPEERRVLAIQDLGADPTLQQLDNYLDGSRFELSPYGRAALTAVRTSAGWHIVEGRNDVAMLTPDEVIDKVVGFPAAWTRLVREEHAHRFLALGRPITVADMESSDPAWLRSDIVLWSYGFVRDSMAWYLIQENGRLPSWVGKLDDSSVVGRDGTVGSWRSVAVGSLKVFNVSMSFDLGVQEVVEVDFGRRLLSDASSGDVVVRPLDGHAVISEAVTPLVIYSSGAVLRTTEVIADGMTDSLRMRLRLKKYDQMRVVSQGTKVRLKMVVPVSRLGLPPGEEGNVSRWKLSETDGRLCVEPLNGHQPDITWMAARGSSFQADVTFRFASVGRVWYTSYRLDCGDSGNLYGEIVDAAVVSAKTVVAEGGLHGLEVGIKIDSFLATGNLAQNDLIDI